MPCFTDYLSLLALPSAVLGRHRSTPRWVGLVSPGQSYLCSSGPRVHFGLGDVTRVESIDVVWPDGHKEVFADVAVNRALVLKKGNGQAPARTGTKKKS
jgi:hypothetical protein